MAIQLFDGIDRLSVLEAENTLLKERLQACEQSHALLQAEIAHYRHHKSSQPTPYPPVINGSPGQRLWSATTAATNALLTIADFDEAVNTAMQILGEALDTDRIYIVENFDPPVDSIFPHWRSLPHEWNSPGIPLQHTDGEAAEGSYEAVPEIFERLSQRQAMSYLIEEAPEPFRSYQMAIGVKSTHLVPIYIAGQWWGVLGLDDCREAKRRSAADLSVLKIAADCIGSAIQRQRTQQGLLRAEQNCAAELTKANATLRRSLSWLAHEGNLNQFLERVLLEIASTTQADLAYLFILREPERMLELTARVLDGAISDHPTPTEPAIFFAPFSADITPAFRYMEEQNLFLTLDMAMLEPELTAIMWPDAIDWHVREGRKQVVGLVLKAGDRSVGFLGLGFHEQREFSQEERELVIALANQASLAILLIRLAEEAKQAAIAREQEQAAQERATELEKASIALQQTIDAVGQLEQLDALLPEVLKIVAAAFGARSCSYFEHPNDERIYLRYWFYEGTVYKPEQLLTLDDRFALVQLLAEGFTVPAEYLGTQHRHRERAVVLDHLSGTCVPEFDAFAKRLDWGGELNVPLVCNGIAVGALVIYRETPVFTQGEITLAESLGKQIALAMQTSQIAERERQIAIAREQEKAAQERAAELATINEALIQRDRLLSVVAQVTQGLLENPNVEQGIAQALQKLGEASGASRMTLFHEKPEPQTGRLQHHILLEWTLSNVRRLMDHPDTCSLYSDDYPDIAAELHAGRSASLHLKDYPSPAPAFWTKFGVHSRGIVPILIEGEYFGCVCFDDCFQNHPWSEQEMDILTAGAGAIGAALLRQRLTEKAKQAAIMQEQERVTELIRANDALKRSLNAIAIVSDPHQIIAHILKIVAEQFDTPLVEYWLHSDNFRTAHISLSCWQGKILTAAEQPDHPGNADFPSLSQQDGLAHSPYFLIDDIRVDPYTRIAAAQIGIDIVAWFQRRGVTRLLNIPLWLNEQTIGSLDIWFPSDRAFTQSQIELAYTFGQQITLTSYLNHLFEETQQTVLFEERNRIASDIHDTLAQAFTGISLQLEAAKPLLRQDPDTVGHILHHISQLAKDGLDEARRSVWALYPPGMEYANLAQMLYNSVEQMSRNTSISLEVNIVGDPCSLSPYLGMNLLRIGQEALTNALKHSQAQTVLIELTYTTDSVSLLIRDDGRGFVPPTDPDSLNGGFGLLGMYERCDRISAQLTILSQPGCGTDILVESPLC